MSAGDETGWDETDTGPPGAGGFGEQPTLIRGQRGAPPALLAPGTRLDRHVVQGELGRGGMGIVWLAQDELLGRQVALKTIRGSIAADGASFRAFENEARMLACLNHPNIATVHDLIVHRGDPVLVMELLDGEDLASRLERGPLGVEETLRVGVQVAMGLAAAHQRGIIHRDLKPANVQLMSSGDAKILDFGLAREWIPGDVVELDGELAGTPAYMSPEQLSGKSLDGRSDLYSFGLLLLECLTAHRALVEGQTELRHPIGERRLVDWSGLPEGLTTGFRELLRACLEENRDDRPSNVLEVREVLKRELRACESGSVVTERAVVLPTERDAFVGRASELAALSEWLVGTSRLLTVLGPGGSGKTRLVVHHAWATVEDHPGGTWFCDLSETTSLEEVVTAVAATLEVPLQDAASVEKLGHALRARGRCLVVLDNFEQVAVHAADVLGPWLELAPEARFVVTSRVVLNLSGEQVLTVEPLGHESAVELFELRARSRNPQFVVDDENRADVQELVRLVDGLPLAIELAAARIRILSPQALVERMSDRFALLTTAPGAAGRQATLRATIEWSWSLLASWEKAALAQTSVFVGGFTLADAEAVLDLSAWDDAPWPLDAVQVLVDKSLLRTWESLPGRAGSGERWFGTDASVREFAVEKLCAPEAIASGASGPEAEQAAIQRHGEHFASLGSERRIAALDRHGGWTARQALSPRRDNLVVACRRALERGDAKTSAGAFVAAWAVMELTGPLVTARELGESVLACESLDASERLRVLLVQVEVSRHAGDVEGAWSLCEEALALAVRAGSRHHEMTARRVKGKLLWLRAQASEARACFEEVLGQARELGDPRGEGLALGALATMDADQGRFDDALARSTKSLSIIREVGDRRQEAMGLVGIGILHRFAGRLDEARECLQESLDIRRELGDRAGEGMVIDNLATLHHDRGDHVEALTCFQDVLATHREVGNRPSEALVQVNIGVIASKLGQLEEADAAFAAAESIMREARGAPRLAMLLISRAEHRQRIGDQAGFRADLAEAESLAEQLGVGPESRIGQAITRLREENGE